MGVPTISSSTFCFAPCNFNPPAPMGVPTFANKSEISRTYKFQSTAPMGVPTVMCCVIENVLYISIHGTLGGADRPGCANAEGAQHFNPRHPWGCRRWKLHPENYGRGRFQSTAPLGVPTRRCCHIRRSGGHFNPRHPWGCRPKLLVCFFGFFCISIHGTLGGADARFSRLHPSPSNFNPRHPWGCRLVHQDILSIMSHFNPRHPWGCRPP